MTRPDPNLPPLHRISIPRSRTPSTMWRIGSTPLLLLFNDYGRWSLTTDEQCAQTRRAAGDWLARHGLRDVLFATRRDAHRAVSALLDNDPLAPLRAAVLTRGRPGVWTTTSVTRGYLTITYQPQFGMYFACDENHVMLAAAATLTDLAFRISQLPAPDRTA